MLVLLLVPSTDTLLDDSREGVAIDTEGNEVALIVNPPEAEKVTLTLPLLLENALPLAMLTLAAAVPELSDTVAASLMLTVAEAVGDTGADADTLPLPHELDEGVGDAGALSVTLLDSDGVPLMHADGDVESERHADADAQSDGDVVNESVGLPHEETDGDGDSDGGAESEAHGDDAPVSLTVALALTVREGDGDVLSL